MNLKGRAELNSHYPYSEEDLAEILRRVRQKENGLTLWEKYFLNKYTRDVCREYPGKTECNPLPDIFFWTDKSRSNRVCAEFPVEGYIKNESRTRETRLHGKYGTVIRGLLNSNLDFNLSVDIMGDISDKDIFNEYRNPVVDGHFYSIPPEDRNEGKGFSNYKTHDNIKGYLRFKLPWFKFMTGKDQIRWGPARINSLLFNGMYSDFEMTKLQGKIGNVNFIQINGRLVADELGDFKNIAAHRLEYSGSSESPVLKYITFGLYEAVVFSERQFEMLYFIPVFPYFFSEHYLGDRDNTSIGFDIKAVTENNISVYTEVFIDDLESPQKFYSDWIGNKWAFTTGAECILPLYNEPEIYLEYTRIEPWVYTHHKNNGQNKYSHFGNPLGAEIGADSDQWNIGLRYPLFKKALFTLNYVDTRHGAGYIANPDLLDENTEKYSGGNNINNVYDPAIHGEVKKFLNGTVEYRNEINLRLSYWFFDNFKIYSGYSYIDISNLNNMKSLNSDSSAVKAGMEFKW